MQGGSGKQNEGDKRLLLLRAAFDMDSLSIPAQEKQKLQKLLSESPLETELKKKYKVTVLNATSIKPNTEYQTLEQLFKKNKNSPSDFPQPDLIIIVSKHAALLARNIFPMDWFRQAQVFSVGKASLPFFASDGVSVQVPEQENGEGLMNLPQLQNIKNKQVLICKGEQGLDYIENECQQRNAKVKVANLYTRCEAVINDLPKAEDVDVLFATSVYALQHFKNQLEKNGAEQKQFLAKPMLVLSERIAKAAKEMGFVSELVVRKMFFI